MIGVFAVLRSAATVGATARTFPDSPSYFDYRVWGGMRMPLVTGFYSVVEHPPAIIAIQAGLGAVCWAAAAVIAGGGLRVRSARLLFQGVLLLVGLTGPVASWDRALLSESLSISLGVLTAALAIRAAATPTGCTVAGLVAAGAAWGLTRPNNAAVLLLGAAVLALAGSARRRRSLSWPAAAVLAAVAALGVAYGQSNDVVRTTNTAQVLARHVVPFPGELTWYEEHGMPDVDPLLSGPFDVNEWSRQMMADPAFSSWLRRYGAETYARWLTEHPGQVFVVAVEDAGPVVGFSGGGPRDEGARRMTPVEVERVLWPRSTDVARFVVLAALVLAVGVPLLLRHCYLFPAATAASVLVWVSSANVVLVALSAGSDHGRLLIGSSAMARVGAVFLVAAVLEARRARTAFA